MMFYTGFGLQLTGLAAVTLCLFSGVNKGQYGQLEFLQLVGGSLIFYVGHFIRSKAQGK